MPVRPITLAQWPASARTPPAALAARLCCRALFCRRRNQQPAACLAVSLPPAQPPRHAPVVLSSLLSMYSTLLRPTPLFAVGPALPCHGSRGSTLPCALREQVLCSSGSDRFICARQLGTTSLACLSACLPVCLPARPPAGLLCSAPLRDGAGGGFGSLAGCVRRAAAAMTE